MSCPLLSSTDFFRHIFVPTYFEKVGYCKSFRLPRICYKQYLRGGLVPCLVMEKPKQYLGVVHLAYRSKPFLSFKSG